MGRLYRNKNGFTLLEMLVVLLIVSILSFGLSTQMNTSLYLFMKKVQTLSITAQEKAYVEHQRIDMSVNSKINVGDIEYYIPKDIVCDPVSFYYNTKDNTLYASFYIHRTFLNIQIKKHLKSVIRKSIAQHLFKIRIKDFFLQKTFL